MAYGQTGKGAFPYLLVKDQTGACEGLTIRRLIFYQRCFFLLIIR